MKITLLIILPFTWLLTGCTSTKEAELEPFETAGSIQIDTYEGEIDRVITKDDNIEEAPNNYIGMTVLITGKIQDMIGSSAIRVDYDGFFGNDDIVLIQPESTLTSSLREKDQIEGVGLVRIFSIYDFEREYSLNLEDKRFQDLEGKPIIVADQIIKVP